MDEKQKQEFILLFNQGFEEIVIPAIEDVEARFGKKVNSLESKMDNRFDAVDKKLDRLDAHDERMADVQVDLRTRLRRVENTVFRKVE